MAANTTQNVPRPPMPGGDLRGQLQVGRPATEKTGSFWPRTSVVSASITEIPVSTGSAGGSRTTGFSGNPPPPRAVAGDRRPAVKRLAPAVAHPAQPACAHRNPHRGAAERDPRGRRGHPPGAFEDLHHGEIPVCLRAPARAGAPPPRPGWWRTRPSPRRHAAHDEQRAPQLRHIGVLGSCPSRSCRAALPGAAAFLSPAGGAVPRAGRAWPVRRSATIRGVADSSRARKIGEKSCSSITAAGTFPALASSTHSSATASMALASAAARALSQYAPPR